LDDARSRFVYPQDRSLVVYFEWQASVGDHVLSATWKGPDGRVATMSPDVKMQTNSSELSAYWIFTIAPQYASGYWTVDIRIDGQPSGSYPFELVLPALPDPKPDPGPAVLPSIEEIYNKTLKSLVWVYKLDEFGKRIDTGTGFVVGRGRVLTAFQTIDAAALLELKFSGDRVVRTKEVWQVNRPEDWAVIKAETFDVPPLERSDQAGPVVGERRIAINVENSTRRVIGGIDVTGREMFPYFGDRLSLMPALSKESAGGPLLDSQGKVIAILGGSTTPGSRNIVSYVRQSILSNVIGQATPLASIPESGVSTAMALGELLASNILTPPLVHSDDLVTGGMSRKLSKDPRFLPENEEQFSRKDPAIFVFTDWRKSGKKVRGQVSIRVFDAQNRTLFNSAPSRVNLVEITPTRLSISFSPAPLAPGVYRVDVSWDDAPAYRTFFKITD
jgi:S1-C subfamily serine protease